MANALTLVEQAVRTRDLETWRKFYDMLNTSHFPPRLGGFVFAGSIVHIPKHYTGTIIANHAGSNQLSRDQVPDESNFALRRSLQTFVELVSASPGKPLAEGAALGAARDSVEENPELRPGVRRVGALP